jgi:hypothetical protein
VCVSSAPYHLFFFWLHFSYVHTSIYAPQFCVCVFVCFCVCVCVCVFFLSPLFSTRQRGP